MRVGEVIAGRYELRGLLGRGSHGVVYEARAVDDGTPVAVKALRPGLAREGAVRRRFAQEAAAASRIRHPNVIATLDAGIDPASGEPFLVQPLLRGLDLKAALLREGRFAPKVAVDLVVPVMAGLLALHREGIVHRDVKPANIFLVRDDGGAVSPVLLDFGVAKFADGDARTVEGQRLGTPAYMAPEQIDGVSDLDGRADVWSIAVVLYELMTGRNPFLGGSVAETFRNVKARRAPPLDGQVEGVDAVLAMVVARALEPDRARRFEAMEALLGAVFDCPTLDADTPGEVMARRHTRSLLVERTDARGTVAVLPLLPLPEEGAAAPADVPRGAWISPALAAEVGNAPTALAEAYERVTPTRPSGRAAQIAAAVAVAAVSFAAAYVAARRGTGEVRMTTRPAAAVVTWDGVRTVGGAARPFARDGRTHTLTVEAPGFATATVVFCDEPPPAVVELTPE